MSRKAKLLVLHLFGWLLLAGLIVGFMNRSTDRLSITRILEPAFLLFIALYASFFYLNVYVLIPRLYLKQQYAFYALLLMLFFAGVYFAKPYENLVIRHQRSERPDAFPPLREMPPPMRFERRGPRGERPERRGLDIVSIVLFFAVWSSSTALRIVGQWRLTERRALQAERDKVAAELSFLKAQINPHFLFNTLNNIYSLSIAGREETPAAILKLSEILHYITYDVRADFVSLQSEVDCVRNYIELQKLRLTDKVAVQFSLNGDLQSKNVPPLLFMTFIENAFKYGISSHEPCTINIAIDAFEKQIDFSCRNKTSVKSTPEERAGVGIRNAKKRLDYLYAEKYSLRIDTEESVFSVHLTIPA